MPTTTRAALRYPVLADTPDVPRDIGNLANDADAVLAMYGQGTFASRPTSSGGSPGKTGRFYYGTDTGHLYYDFGTGWTDIGPTAAGLSPNSVTSVELADNAVDTAAIQALAVTAAKIANGTITVTQIASALLPSGGAGAGTEALRALGTAAGTAAAGMHASQHSRTGADPLVIATFISSGLFAARPSTSLVSGMVYTATDVGGGTAYTYNGSSWITMGAGVSGTATVTYATTPPGSPNNGDIWIYVDSTTNPTVQWQFRYNASSSSAYKWEFIGGTDLYVTAAGGVAPPGTTYVTSSGLTVTLPRAGDYNLEYGFRANPGNDNDALMAPNGAGITASDAFAAQAGMNGGGTTGILVTPAWAADFFGCTAALITFMLKRSAATGATVNNPWVKVRPKRVS